MRVHACATASPSTTCCGCATTTRRGPCRSRRSAAGRPPALPPRWRGAASRCSTRPRCSAPARPLRSSARASALPPRWRGAASRCSTRPRCSAPARPLRSSARASALRWSSTRGSPTSGPGARPAGHGVSGRDRARPVACPAQRRREPAGPSGTGPWFRRLARCRASPDRGARGARRDAACSQEPRRGLPPEATIDLAFGNCEVYSFAL